MPRETESRIAENYREKQTTHAEAESPPRRAEIRREKKKTTSKRERKPPKLNHRQEEQKSAERSKIYAKKAETAKKSKSKSQD